jgi:hypothetical protein
LPKKTFVVRLVDGVEVVGLGVDGSALVDNFLFLPVNVLKVLGLVPGLECLEVRVEVEVFHSEVIEEGIGRASERVEEGVELLFGASIVDVVLQLLLLLLLDHQQY